MKNPSEPTPLFRTDRLVARAVTPAEQALLQWVFERCGDFFQPITGRPAPDADAAEREVGSCAATPGREVAVLVREETGEPVGALGWWQGNPDPETTLLGMLMVVPAERKRGIAREAIDGLAAWASGRGIRRLRTGVAAQATATHALLRSLGFEPLDQRTHVSVDRGRMMIALFDRAV